MTKPLFNPTADDERCHLSRVLAVIRSEWDESNARVGHSVEEVLELKQYLQEHRSEMDHVEKVSVRQTIEQQTVLGEHRQARHQELSRLRKRPYFGRIDFVENRNPVLRPLYIGVHSFQDPQQGQSLVHDWRAPISSMFYDFETGPAFFTSPEGRVEGELTLKRQFRIENGSMRFMLETSLNIHDDLLQEELSRASSDTMRSIVATIQRDQNAVIRNDHAGALIIQGAAGSGKTSIALHRVAYLLYAFKDTIQSDNVLIISPNRVFGHYISDVLPELGEKAIQETTMEKLAAHVLNYQVPFQSFFEQVSTLMQPGHQPYAERVEFKSTIGFIHKLESYAQYVRAHNLTAKPISLGANSIEADEIERLFGRVARLPYAEQINYVVDALVGKAESQWGWSVAGEARKELRKALGGMFWATEITKLYKHFYEWTDEPALFLLGKDGRYEFADVFPLIYLKILLEGAPPHDRIKHLVVDEMQDYTPIQYRVLDRLFPCRKTVLGDRNQSVNPHGASTAEMIREVLDASVCMYMHKSYRSTVEICELTQHIRRNPEMIPLDRHGDEVRLVTCATRDEEYEVIKRKVEQFSRSPHNSMGIICKTQEQADACYEALKDSHEQVHTLTFESTLFSGGVVVATAHLVKGVEFDHVLVPGCDAARYARPIDRYMLYVACTRAMHELTLTHAGPLSPFLKEAPVRISRGAAQDAIDLLNK